MTGRTPLRHKWRNFHHRKDGSRGRVGDHPGPRVCAEAKAILLDASNQVKRFRRASPAYRDSTVRVHFPGRPDCFLPLADTPALVGGGVANPQVSGAVSSSPSLSKLSISVRCMETAGRRPEESREVEGRQSRWKQHHAEDCVHPRLAYVGPGALSGLVTMTGNIAIVGVTGIIVGLYGLANLLVALFDTKEQRAPARPHRGNTGNRPKLSSLDDADD